MLFCRCKCLCRSSKIWWSIKVVWWWISCILAFINVILQIVKFLKQQIQLNTQKRGGSLKLNCIGDVLWVLHCCTLPLCSHKYNPTPLCSIPLWLHTFLATLVSTFIGTVLAQYWHSILESHFYKRALGLISQSKLTMPNCIPSPLPTVSFAYLHAHMYTSPR